MEDKTKLQKGVGQIKEGMGKISEGVGQIVEEKFDPDKPVVKPLPPEQRPIPPSQRGAFDDTAKPAVTAHKPIMTLGEIAKAEGPAPEVAPAVAVKPDPKPVPNAPNVKKGEGITYIGKYKKFHAEFKASGQTYHVGMFDTETQAVAAIATAKAHLYP